MQKFDFNSHKIKILVLVYAISLNTMSLGLWNWVPFGIQFKNPTFILYTLTLWNFSNIKLPQFFSSHNININNTLGVKDPTLYVFFAQFKKNDKIFQL